MKLSRRAFLSGVAAVAVAPKTFAAEPPSTDIFKLIASWHSVDASPWANFKIQPNDGQKRALSGLISSLKERQVWEGEDDISFLSQVWVDGKEIRIPIGLEKKREVYDALYESGKFVVSRFSNRKPEGDLSCETKATTR